MVFYYIERYLKRFLKWLIFYGLLQPEGGMAFFAPGKVIGQMKDVVGARFVCSFFPGLKPRVTCVKPLKGLLY
jgi:hypothetical protein